MYSELWVQAPPATLEEASRRAVTAGVSSWGGELGSGSVPLPAMAALGSAGGRGRRTQSPPPLLSGSAAEVWTSTGMMEGVRCGSSRVWGKVWTYTCAEEVVHLTCLHPNCAPRFKYRASVQPLCECATLIQRYCFIAHSPPSPNVMPLPQASRTLRVLLLDSHRLSQGEPSRPRPRPAPHSAGHPQPRPLLPPRRWTAAAAPPAVAQPRLG